MWFLFYFHHGAHGELCVTTINLNETKVDRPYVPPILKHLFLYNIVAWQADTVYNKISLAKIFAKGSYFVLGQKFHQILFCQLCELPSRKLWVGELLCAYARALTIAQTHCAKKFVEKFLPTAYIGEIGKKFILAKISTYTVFGWS